MADRPALRPVCGEGGVLQGDQGVEIGERGGPDRRLGEPVADRVAQGRSRPRRRGGSGRPGHRLLTCVFCPLRSDARFRPAWEARTAPSARSGCVVFATGRTGCGFRAEKRAVRGVFPLPGRACLRICAVPNFARACGRVSVGGHPVNCRTAARGLKGSMVARVDPYGRHPGGNTGPRQQPAAGGETGEPRSPRGTQLKATTNGLFGLVGPPQAGTEEACFSLPGVRWGSSLPIHGSFRVLCARTDARVSKARGSARRIAP